MFGVGEAFYQELLAAYAPDYQLTQATSFEEMKQAVLDESNPAQRVGIITPPTTYQVLEFTKPPHHNLSVGTLQEFLDKYVKGHEDVEIDYVHGDDVLDKLSKQEGNMGFYLPRSPRTTSSNLLFSTAPFPEKLSQWVMPMISASIWKPDVFYNTTNLDLSNNCAIFKRKQTSIGVKMTTRKKNNHSEKKQADANDANMQEAKKGSP